jgi:hypothetical protein
MKICLDYLDLLGICLELSGIAWNSLELFGITWNLLFTLILFGFHEVFLTEGAVMQRPQCWSRLEPVARSGAGAELRIIIILLLLILCVHCIFDTIDFTFREIKYDNIIYLKNKIF